VAERRAAWGAAAAGLAVPALVSGRATMAALLVAALVLFALAPGMVAAWRRAAAALGSPPGWAALAMFVLWLPAVAGSLDPWASVQVWARMAVFLPAAVLLWARLANDAEAARVALRALVGGGLLAAALAAAGPWLAPGLVALLRGHAPPWHADEAALALKGFGSALACLAPAVLWAGWRLGGGWRWMGVAAAVLAVAGMVAVRSHAGLAGMAGAAAVGVLWHGVRAGRVRVTAPLLGLVAALGLAAAFACSTGAGALGLPTGLVDAHRQAIWSFALGHVPQAPVFGHGIDIVDRLPGADVVVPAFDNQARIPSHTHNALVELLVETGAVGLAAALVALGLFVAGLTRRGDDAAWAALAVVAAYAVSSQVNFSVWAAWWQGTGLVLAALVLASAAPAPPSGGRP